MSEPTGRFAGELYDALRPLAFADEENDWALAEFCEGIGAMFEPIAQLIRDTEDAPGWSAVLDLDRAPFLDWLAQFNGTSTERVIEDDDKRDLIRDAPGFRRGSVDSIKGAARTALTGQKRVTLVERDGSAYALRVITFEDETPDPAAVVRAIKAVAKPAGIVLTHDVLPGWIIEEMEEFYDGITIEDGPETEFASLADFERRVI